MKKAACFIVPLFFIFSPEIHAQLSPLSSVSVLTCSPGTELYSVFGHSAIRVKDPGLGMDIVFNYGTFDFETPNFYMKFVKGHLNYMLSVSGYDDFEAVYIQENRSIYEQVLLLNLTQRQGLFLNLMENYKPENRYYLYDFFFDNCASRIRDIVDVSLHDSLVFSTAGFTEKLSFRQLIDPYLEKMKWIHFGIDLALGVPADRIAHPVEYMFLPDHVFEHFQQASLSLSDSTAMMITGEPATLYTAPEVKHNSFFPGPGLLFWTLCIVVVLLGLPVTRRKIPLLWFDRIFFSLAGLTGWFLCLLWFATDHYVMNYNHNLLWAIPFFFPLGLLLPNRRKNKVIPAFFTAASVLLLLLLLSWPLLARRFSPGFLPVMIILFVRSAYHSYFSSWIENKLPTLLPQRG